jgi:hypothetical protein
MSTEFKIPSGGILVRIMPPDSSPAASQAPPPYLPSSSGKKVRIKTANDTFLILENGAKIKPTSVTKIYAQYYDEGADYLTKYPLDEEGHIRPGDVNFLRRGGPFVDYDEPGQTGQTGARRRSSRKNVRTIKRVKTAKRSRSVKSRKYRNRK